MNPFLATVMAGITLAYAHENTDAVVDITLSACIKNLLIIFARTDSNSIAVCFVVACYCACSYIQANIWKFCKQLVHVFDAISRHVMSRGDTSLRALIFPARNTSVRASCLHDHTSAAVQSCARFLIVGLNRSLTARPLDFCRKLNVELFFSAAPW